MSLDELRQVRINKLEKIKEVFGGAYPAKVSRDLSVQEALADFEKLSKDEKPVFLVGRVFGVRKHGGMIFADFSDTFWGSKEDRISLQIYLKKDEIGEDKFDLFEEVVDMGDFVELGGTLFETQRGEKSIKVSRWRIVSKGLRPLPEKWHGLSGVEERYRKRYLDLLMNSEVSEAFVLRSKLITEIRSFLNKNGFIEVETPMLQPMAGGALAKPFKTHHNALDIDLFLRIAPELYLKRLLVGGFEKVYEIGRNFRNEGIDVTHNPEFTMLEFYQAYEDAEYGRTFVEDMIKTLVKNLFDKEEIDHEGQKISFKEKFAVISFFDVLKEYAGLESPEEMTLEDYRAKAKELKVDFGEADSAAKIADSIFGKVCRSKLVQPTFVVDHPLGISPLSKKREDNPHLVDRFQLVINGFELTNGFSELNDPLDQRERFEKQQEARKAGDEEAAQLDENYLEAMEYGMPPAYGVGIGIDRLAMFFLGVHNIRDVVLFPTLRPKE